ncbi:hypothetical protein [Vibrio alginolyticus]|uniref:hypothetical protein n=1 Tax=Vibrio alginolyticus TaxID=663 RepID=UPI0002F9760D|nr:hypothetical protein [Vibrio alginolyticus]ELA9729596.1 hypothetical protein [Vibrio alginolyticus]ELB2903504.1 hypothetical protein [Vibrio alginolyticus]
MQYAAIMLCADGGLIRHEETLEVANVMVGDDSGIGGGMTHQKFTVFSVGKDKLRIDYESV